MLKSTREYLAVYILLVQDDVSEVISESGWSCDVMMIS